MDPRQSTMETLRPIGWNRAMTFHYSNHLDLNHPDDAEPIVVIGATGKTGRRVTQRLTSHGYPVRAASRASKTAFDWERPETWAAALAGARAAYVTYQPDVSIPQAAIAMSELVKVAANAGVDRIVLLSGRGEDGARACEDIVMNGLPESTVLACAWFNQNFSEGLLRDGVLSGAIALPVDPVVSEPFLDADDIADAAVAALADDRHRGRRYELTGPESLSFGQVAATLSSALGRPVAFVPVSREEFLAGAIAGGVPTDEAETLAAVLGEVLDGRNAATADGVRRVLGRPPTNFEAFARRAAAAGAWTVEEERAS
jgi:uncharacterized protein YbjT (DUF2867 family)